MLTGNRAEKIIIKLIQSLDRIMDTWDKMTLRRTIVNIFTILLFFQILITTLFWMFGREIDAEWRWIIGIEFGAWGTILAYYFNLRGKADAEEIRQNSECDSPKEEENHE